MFSPSAAMSQLRVCVPAASEVSPPSEAASYVSPVISSVAETFIVEISPNSMSVAAFSVRV